MLFTNERDEVTEGGRSNLFVKLNGRWWTPPIASGILPGIMRGMMLEDLDLGAQEKPLTLSEVMTAEELLLCSSLRGHLRTEMRRRPASERFDIGSHVPSLPR
jgi:para-aminobenzoate synthetase/4-amino-4-deoxychorismate lyase